MRKLADHGQAILCTIHQPSAILMQQFDRLLFLAKGGKTVYFGELGPNMETLIKYFENKGSSKCPKNANPAEWMLEVIGAAPGSHADRDWPEVWNNSPERAQARAELAQMKEELLQRPPPPRTKEYGEFAMPLWVQFLVCLQRMFQQYWRSPSYIYSKAATCIIPVSGMLLRHDEAVMSDYQRPSPCSSASRFGVSRQVCKACRIKCSPSSCC
jgi:hypothetical protein